MECTGLSWDFVIGMLSGMSLCVLLIPLYWGK